MDVRIQLVAILACVGLFLVVLELVRRKRLMERYALLWMFSAAVLLGLSIWRDLLEEVARAIGIYYAPSALFVIAFGCVAILLLHFSIVISRLADQSKLLAQRVSILQQRIDELEGRPEATPAQAQGRPQGDRETAALR